jgi:sec-independent protein translocase protein TatB
MFDIGFLELVIIGVVGLLVIGPERLPGAIRTASLWMARIRRGFNDIKQEVKQEIHNDAVMQELRKTGEQLKEQTDGISQDIRDAGRSITGTTDTDDHLAPPGTADPMPLSSETVEPGQAESIADGDATGSATHSSKDVG